MGAEQKFSHSSTSIRRASPASAQIPWCAATCVALPAPACAHCSCTLHFTLSTANRIHNDILRPHTHLALTHTHCTLSHCKSPRVGAHASRSHLLHREGTVTVDGARRLCIEEGLYGRGGRRLPPGHGKGRRGDVSSLARALRTAPM